MDLGLMGVAYKGVQDGRRQVKDDEALDRLRALRMAQDDASLSSLPSRTEADQAGNALRSASDRASLSLVPGRTELAGLQLAGQKSDAEFNNGQQPVTQATRAANNELGLSSAKFGLEQQPTEQTIAADNNKVKKALADHSVDDLPRVIAERKRAGIFSDADVSTTAVAKLADLVQAGDGPAAIKFMNDMHATGAVPALGNKTVAQIGFTKDPKTGENVLTALDADGQPIIQMSEKKMRAIRDSIGKTDLKEVHPGGSLVGIKNGRASLLYEAPEKVAGANQHTPADVQMAEWMIKNGVAKNANEAWDKVRSAREKTKPSFVSDMMKKVSEFQTDPKELQKLESTYGAMYDRLHSGSAAASNTPSASTLNPQIKSLLGIP